MSAKKQIIALFISSALCSISPVHAANIGLAFSSGDGVLDISPYRVAMSLDFGNIWRENYDWGLNFIWESSVGYWQGRSDYAVGTTDRLDVVTSGPLFRWQRQTPLYPFHITPYIELGVGASWLSETEIGGRQLSLHFQFEDKLGLGTRFGKKQQYDIAVRGIHYSNASIKRPNSGVNLLMVSVGMWFIE